MAAPRRLSMAPVVRRPDFSRDYSVYRIVEEGVGEAAESRDGTGCALDPHMIRGKWRLL